MSISSPYLVPVHSAGILGRRTKLQRLGRSCSRRAFHGGWHMREQKVTPGSAGCVGPGRVSFNNRVSLNNLEGLYNMERAKR